MKGERELCRNLGKECCSRGNSKYKGLRQKSRCLTCLSNKAEASTAEIEWKGEYKDNKAKETLRSQITWGLEGQASPHNQTHCFLLVLLVGMLQPPQGLCTCCVLFSGSFLVLSPSQKAQCGQAPYLFPYQCITTAQSGREKLHNKCSWAEWMRDGGRIFSSLPCVQLPRGAFSALQSL